MNVKQHASSKTRREKRKDGRKLKKMRRDCFYRHKPIPTQESLEAEELERQRQQMMRREKMKEKIQKKQERQEMEEAAKEAEEEKKRQLEIINREDHKTIRELERKLKIKPKLNTWPSAFKNDHLDYILNYKEEAELLKSYVESGKDKSKSRKRLHSADEDDSLASDEENVSLTLDDSEEDSDDKGEERNGDSDSSSSDTDSEIDLDDDDDDKDDEDDTDDAEVEDKSEDEEEEEELDESEEEDNEVSGDSENSGEDDEDANGKMLKGKLTSKKDADVKGILNEPKSKDKQKKKTVGFVDKSAVEQTKKKQLGALTEDIYGRLRDSQGNIVKDSNAFVPPGRRLQQRDGEGLETLKVQISRVINRLHDKQMQMFSSQMENLFVSHSRADVIEVLTNELIKDSIKNELIKRNRAMDSMLLLAILHTKVGNEVSAVFLEALVAKFDELFQTVDDSDGAETENQFENAVLLVVHLYQFKVLDCYLIYSIIEKLVSRFFVKDIHLLTLVWKEIGFCLRKDNPKVFQKIYLKTTEMVSMVDKEYAHKRVLSMQLSEILLAVKSNNPKKLPKDDEEELESRQKLLKTTLSDSVNAPLHISLDDLLKAEQKGKWWLVGSAWTGSSESALKHDVDDKTTVPQVDGVNLTKLAQKLHMNTDVRKKILFAIVTSNNYREAFERVMKLGLTRRQDKDVIHVISTLHKRGKGNPFYTHLAEAFRKYHKRFKKLPGISENFPVEEEMDFD